MTEFISNSEDETMAFARDFAKTLDKTDVIVLLGELGAGKTKFTEGILDYFGFENEISSPTFTIVNEYKNNNVNIYHFDVYRLEDEDEFLGIGGDEYFGKGICIIEWGEKIIDLLPKNYIEVKFDYDKENVNRRKISYEKFSN